MAAVDKIYGNKEQVIEVFKFLEETKDKQIQDLGHKIKSGYIKDVKSLIDGEQYAILNLDCVDDMWLLLNCPLTWLKDRIAENYNIDITSPNTVKELLFEVRGIFYSSIGEKYIQFQELVKENKSNIGKIDKMIDSLKWVEE